MEELKKALIGEDGKVICPYCGKTNGRVDGSEFVYNYRIRCRGSRRGREHFFLLFAGNEENIERMDGGSAG